MGKMVLYDSFVPIVQCGVSLVDPKQSQLEQPLREIDQRKADSEVGPAEFCCRLRRRGFAVVAINGISVEEHTHEEILKLLCEWCQHQRCAVIRFRAADDNDEVDRKESGQRQLPFGALPFCFHSSIGRANYRSLHLHQDEVHQLHQDALKLHIAHGEEKFRWDQGRLQLQDRAPSAHKEFSENTNIAQPLTSLHRLESEQHFRIFAMPAQQPRAQSGKPFRTFGGEEPARIRGGGGDDNDEADEAPVQDRNTQLQADQSARESDDPEQTLAPSSLLTSDAQAANTCKDKHSSLPAGHKPCGATPPSTAPAAPKPIDAIAGAVESTDGQAAATPVADEGSDVKAAGAPSAHASSSSKTAEAPAADQSPDAIAAGSPAADESSDAKATAKATGTLSAGESADARAPATPAADESSGAKATGTPAVDESSDAKATGTPAADESADAKAPASPAADESADAKATDTLAAGESTDANAADTLAAAESAESTATGTQAAGESADAIAAGAPPADESADAKTCSADESADARAPDANAAGTLAVDDDESADSKVKGTPPADECADAKTCSADESADAKAPGSNAAGTLAADESADSKATGTQTANESSNAKAAGAPVVDGSADANASAAHESSDANAAGTPAEHESSEAIATGRQAEDESADAKAALALAADERPGPEIVGASPADENSDAKAAGIPPAKNSPDTKAARTVAAVECSDPKAARTPGAVGSIDAKVAGTLAAHKKSEAVECGKAAGTSASAADEISDVKAAGASLVDESLDVKADGAPAVGCLDAKAAKTNKQPPVSAAEGPSAPATAGPIDSAAAGEVEQQCTPAASSPEKAKPQKLKLTDDGTTEGDVLEPGGAARVEKRQMFASMENTAASEAETPRTSELTNGELADGEETKRSSEQMDDEATSATQHKPAPVHHSAPNQISDAPQRSETQKKRSRDTEAGGPGDSNAEQPKKAKTETDFEVHGNKGIKGVGEKAMDASTVSSGAVARDCEDTKDAEHQHSNEELNKEPKLNAALHAEEVNTGETMADGGATKSGGECTGSAGESGKKTESAENGDEVSAKQPSNSLPAALPEDEGLISNRNYQAGRHFLVMPLDNVRRSSSQVHLECRYCGYVYRFSSPSTFCKSISHLRIHLTRCKAIPTNIQEELLALPVAKRSDGQRTIDYATRVWKRAEDLMEPDYHREQVAQQTLELLQEQEQMREQKKRGVRTKKSPKRPTRGNDSPSESVTYAENIDGDRARSEGLGGGESGDEESDGQYPVDERPLLARRQDERILSKGLFLTCRQYWVSIAKGHRTRRLVQCCHCKAYRTCSSRATMQACLPELTQHLLKICPDSPQSVKDDLLIQNQQQQAPEDDEAISKFVTKLWSRKDVVVAIPQPQGATKQKTLYLPVVAHKRGTDKALLVLPDDEGTTSELFDKACQQFWVSVAPGHKTRRLVQCCHCGAFRTCSNFNIMQGCIPDLVQHLLDVCPEVPGSVKREVEDANARQSVEPTAECMTRFVERVWLREDVPIAEPQQMKCSKTISLVPPAPPDAVAEEKPRTLLALPEDESTTDRVCFLTCLQYWVLSSPYNKNRRLVECIHCNAYRSFSKPGLLEAFLPNLTLHLLQVCADIPDAVKQDLALANTAQAGAPPLDIADFAAKAWQREDIAVAPESSSATGEKKMLLPITTKDTHISVEQRTFLALPEDKDAIGEHNHLSLSQYWISIAPRHRARRYLQCCHCRASKICSNPGPLEAYLPQMTGHLEVCPELPPSLKDDLERLRKKETDEEVDALAGALTEFCIKVWEREDVVVATPLERTNKAHRATLSLAPPAPAKREEKSLLALPDDEDLIGELYYLSCLQYWVSCPQRCRSRRMVQCCHCKKVRTCSTPHLMEGRISHFAEHLLQVCPNVPAGVKRDLERANRSHCPPTAALLKEFVANVWEREDVQLVPQRLVIEQMSDLMWFVGETKPKSALPALPASPKPSPSRPSRSSKKVRPVVVNTPVRPAASTPVRPAASTPVRPAVNAPRHRLMDSFVEPVPEKESTPSSDEKETNTRKRRASRDDGRDGKRGKQGRASGHGVEDKRKRDAAEQDSGRYASSPATRAGATERRESFSEEEPSFEKRKPVIVELVKPRFVAGTKVKKYFDGYGWFSGTIENVLKDRYRVKYEDGDEEEYLFSKKGEDLLSRIVVPGKFKTEDDRDLQLWNERFQELCSFYRGTGHCNVVPGDDNDETDLLAVWVHEQREQYALLQEGKPCTITQTQIDELNSLDFDWNLPTYASSEEDNNDDNKNNDDQNDGYEETEMEAEDDDDDGLKWIQCDRCRKWRVLFGKDGTPSRATISGAWHCSMNGDPHNRRCSAPERSEEWYKEEAEKSQLAMLF